MKIENRWCLCSLKMDSNNNYFLFCHRWNYFYEVVCFSVSKWIILFHWFLSNILQLWCRKNCKCEVLSILSLYDWSYWAYNSLKDLYILSIFKLNLPGNDISKLIVYSKSSSGIDFYLFFSFKITTYKAFITTR